jgi:hypothetical protein
MWLLLVYAFNIISAKRSRTGSLELSSYDDKIVVNTVFGTGRAATTDSPGLIGEINTPTDSIFDSTENYLYLTDMNGGGLLRKLAVTSAYTSPFTSLYSVKTVWAGFILYQFLIF